MIQFLGYKTTPMVGTTILAKQLLSEGFYLSGVPGFYHNDEGQWTFIKNFRGILIPVRNHEGKIQGLQLRRDDVSKRKFRWVSSAGRQDGSKAECWTHLVGPPQETVIITEGPMKADVIHSLTGQTVLAVPGVNSLNHLKATLKYLKENGTKQIMTAFDMDYLTNPHVTNGYRDLSGMTAYIHSIQTHDTYSLYSRTYYVKNQAIIVRDKHLGEALQYIIPQKRAVILLSYFAGYNDTEVANILGISPTSISRRKKSALLRLRELLEVRANDE